MIDILNEKILIKNLNVFLINGIIQNKLKVLVKHLLIIPLIHVIPSLVLKLYHYHKQKLNVYNLNGKIYMKII